MDLYENKNIKPMLLSEENIPFNNKDYLYEIKFDGIRTIIYVSSKEIIIKSRNGKILNEVFPELLNIKELVNKRCIFDGELIIMDKGIPSFKRIQERLAIKNNKKIKYYKENYPATFICFDILYENNNLIDLELIKRKEVLSKYKDTEYFVKSRVVMEDGIKLFNIIKENNLEGIVAKLKSSKYILNKRSENWIKIKNILEDIYYVCGYKEKDNVVSILLGDKTNNRFKFISKVVLGKRTNAYSLIKKCKIIKNIFIDFKDDSYIYIIPKYKCIVSYLEKTNNNHLRHPVFKELIES